MRKESRHELNREDYKNLSLKEAGMRVRALEETNSILSSYLGFLIAKCGTVLMPKSVISSGIGNFDISVTAVGDNYEIKALPKNEDVLLLSDDIVIGEVGNSVSFFAEE